jgi:hypothetical protein
VLNFMCPREMACHLVVCPPRGWYSRRVWRWGCITPRRGVRFFDLSGEPQPTLGKVKMHELAFRVGHGVGCLETLVCSRAEFVASHCGPGLARRPEAMRDLSRAREAARKDLKGKRQQVSSFMLRLGRHFPGKKTWDPAHMNCLMLQKLDHREQRIVLEELLGAVRQESERVERLEQAIRDAVPEWSLAEVATALQAMRGIDLVAAVTVLAEIGDLSRFQKPRELMGYLGLVPSESSTGDTVNRGGINLPDSAARISARLLWKALELPMRLVRVWFKNDTGRAVTSLGAHQGAARMNPADTSRDKTGRGKCNVPTLGETDVCQVSRRQHRGAFIFLLGDGGELLPARRQHASSKGRRHASRTRA